MCDFDGFFLYWVGDWCPVVFMWEECFVGCWLISFEFFFGISGKCEENLLILRKF